MNTATPNALALDTRGNVYVVGGSGSNDYHTLKYDPQGSVLWSIRLAGEGSGCCVAGAYDLALDGEGNVYVTGALVGADGYYDDVTVKYVQHQQSESSRFHRGDTNSYSTLDIADAIFTLSYLFVEGAPPSCLDAADANDDGTIDVADAISLLSHLFAGNGPLPSPSTECGLDPMADEFDCAEYPGCE